MKIGDLVSHKSSCFDEPWIGGIIVDTRDEEWGHNIEGTQKLTQHEVYWATHDGTRWIEEGLLEIELEGKNVL